MVQVFSTVTKSPKGENFDKNSGEGPDRITQLAIAQHWPMRTWSSLKERALYQAERLHKIEDRDSEFTIARTGTNFETALSDNHLVGILATEGAHPLECSCYSAEALADVCVVGSVCSWPGSQVPQCQLEGSLSRRFSRNCLGRQVDSE